MLKSLLPALLIASLSYGQWTYKTIKSDFDGSFKKAFTETNNYGYLVMEAGTTSSAPFFAIKGSYFCDDKTSIDFVLTVNGEPKRYVLDASKSSDSSLYYFNDEIWTDEFISDFKNATKCLIRVNQEYCRDDYYVFNMRNSSAAYNFISN